MGILKLLPSALIVAAAFLCISKAECCQADIIVVGNISAATSYLNGYIVSSSGGTNNSIVQGFTMTESIAMTGADLYLQGFQDNVGPEVALAIYADNGNLRPSSTKLYDLTATTPLTNSPGLVHFSGAGTLNIGQTYWLNLYSTNPGGSNGDVIQWMRASPGIPSGSYATYLGEIRSIGAGNPPTGTPELGSNRTAFQIVGNIEAVPEPSSILVFGVTCVCVACYRMRIIRRNIEPKQSAASVGCATRIGLSSGDGS